ncbi:hypothetical protein [Rhizobium oryzicola]|uniref:Uncharacterized protein n=1 Tax=Rhizobium oryzicola TaxID=1232668 RepID=A0ABT8SXM6_9HYPH|nr:hypothetical protein [Rhizobium oryzicola]MDO1583209.1 hypothetical protein [Rhizobium oryzicola]
MMIGGIPSSVIRDLLLLIGQNIGGSAPSVTDPDLPKIDDPSHRSTLTDFSVIEVDKYESRSSEVGLAGLRSPFADAQRPEAHNAIRETLKKFALANSSTVPADARSFDARLTSEGIGHAQTRSAEVNGTTQAPSGVDAAELSSPASTNLTVSTLDPASRGSAQYISTLSDPFLDLPALTVGLGPPDASIGRDADPSLDPMHAPASEKERGKLDERLALLDLVSVLEHLLTDERDGADGVSLTPPQQQMQPFQVERAGIIASFILNAAMIPGWPPPRPIEGVPAVVASFVQQQKELSDVERDLLLSIGKVLNAPKSLEKLLRILKASAKRAKLLAALDFLLAVTEDLVALLRAELERLEDLASDGESGSRQRLHLK